MLTNPVNNVGQSVENYFSIYINFFLTHFSHTVISPLCDSYGNYVPLQSVLFIRKDPFNVLGNLIKNILPILFISEWWTANSEVTKRHNLEK